jgi:DNA-binding Lrp family transcriptional regulator
MDMFLRSQSDTKFEYVRGRIIMVKSSREQIQKDEMKVLLELMVNAKGNVEEIAKSCGFSRQKVWRIIKQLEERKLIWGYSTVFDYQKVGLQHFILLLKRTTIGLPDNEKKRIIDREIIGIAKKYGMIIENSAYLHGQYDWMVTCLAPNVVVVKKFADEMNRNYPDFLENLLILQSLGFFTKNYIVNPEREKLHEIM